MHALVVLLTSIAPLVVFASVSPVVTLNASTAVTTQGQRGGWRFVAGQAVVLLVLGTAFVGMLGASASEFAARQIASKVVDRLLGVALVAYGARLAVSHHRRNRTEEGWHPDPAGSGTATGMFAWGALGMATNFTTLPVFASVSQRIGAADISWVLRIPLLLVVTCCVLTPCWAPVVIARHRPERATIAPRTRAVVARWTSAVSIAACFVGGLVLLWTSR